MRLVFVLTNGATMGLATTIRNFISQGSGARGVPFFDATFDAAKISLLVEPNLGSKKGEYFLDGVPGIKDQNTRKLSTLEYFSPMVRQTYASHYDRNTKFLISMWSGFTCGVFMARFTCKFVDLIDRTCDAYQRQILRLTNSELNSE